MMKKDYYKDLQKAYESVYKTGSESLNEAPTSPFPDSAFPGSFPLGNGYYLNPKTGLRYSTRASWISGGPPGFTYPTDGRTEGTSDEIKRAREWDAQRRAARDAQTQTQTPKPEPTRRSGPIPLEVIPYVPATAKPEQTAKPEPTTATAKPEQTPKPEPTTATAKPEPTTPDKGSLESTINDIRAMRMRSLQRQGNTAAADQIRKTLPSSVASASDETAKELERIRGSAALKSLQTSPLGRRILSGRARSPEANRIAQQSIERSGISRDKLVAASSNKSEFDKLLSAPPAKPQPQTPTSSTSSSSSTSPTSSTSSTSSSTTPTTTPTPTSSTTSVKPTGLTPEQIKQYNRAWSNKDNFLARGTIRGHYNKLTPEQQKAFRAHAQSQGHVWPEKYFESYILEYLVAEGYADTEEAALAIMDNMSEEFTTINTYKTTGQMKAEDQNKLMEAYYSIYTPKEEIVESEQLDEFLGPKAQEFVDRVTRTIQGGLEKIPGVKINRTRRGTVTKAEQENRIQQNKEDVDLFDIIKGHLMSEGYADTEEAALAIMANMSEEWRQSIVEAPYTLTNADKKGNTTAWQNRNKVGVDGKPIYVMAPHLKGV